MEHIPPLAASLLSIFDGSDPLELDFLYHLIPSYHLYSQRLKCSIILFYFQSNLALWVDTSSTFVTFLIYVFFVLSIIFIPPPSIAFCVCVNLWIVLFVNVQVCKLHVKRGNVSDYFGFHEYFFVNIGSMFRLLSHTDARNPDNC